MNNIRNSDDLRTAIESLKIGSAAQLKHIKARFSGPKAIFKTITSLFPGSSRAGGSHWKLWLRPALRFVPAITVCLFFKRSSFINKSLLGVAGQIAHKLVSRQNNERRAIKKFNLDLTRANRCRCDMLNNYG